MSGSRRRRRPTGAVSSKLRITYQMQVVLAAFLKDPAVELYGLEIVARTGLLPGTVYAILGRLLDHGWVSERWEDADPSQLERPQRCYYRLTPLGVAKAGAALSRLGIPSRACYSRPVRRVLLRNERNAASRKRRATSSWTMSSTHFATRTAMVTGP